MAERPFLLVTCEHAGNRVPEPYRALFAGQEELLDSHRGYDLGALPLARSLSRLLRAPLRYQRVTRLLVDANRDAANPRVFSPATRQLPPSLRTALLRRYHAPYRRRVSTLVGQAVSRGQPVMHLAVHTFTPVWEGRERDLDVGLLYDPGRAVERSLCRAWQSGLGVALPALRVRRNAPYRGVSDGLPTALRRRWGSEAYWGVELEVCQVLASMPRAEQKPLQRALADTLLVALRANAVRC